MPPLYQILRGYPWELFNKAQIVYKLYTPAPQSVAARQAGSLMPDEMRKFAPRAVAE